MSRKREELEKKDEERDQWKKICKIWETAEEIWNRNKGWLTHQTHKKREEENDDRRQTWITSKPNEKHTLKLHADPTHLVRLSMSLSSAALKKQPAHMKIVQVIKVWRGSSPSHPQPADSVQTDIEPACAEQRCHTWMESEWRQDEKKRRKKVKQRTYDRRTYWVRKAQGLFMSTSICPDIEENKWFKFEEEKKKWHGIINDKQA